MEIVMVESPFFSVYPVLVTPLLPFYCSTISHEQEIVEDRCCYLVGVIKKIGKALKKSIRVVLKKLFII